MRPPRLLAVLGLMMVTAGCADETDSTNAKSEGSAGAPPTVVHATRARMMDVAPRVTVVGSITPVRQSVVASGASGVVQEFLVNHGDYVETGTPLSLLRMDATDLEIAKATALCQEYKLRWDELKHTRPEEVAEAEARMHAVEARKVQAERKFETAQRLKEHNVTTGTDLTDVKAARDSVQKEHEAAVQLHKLAVAGPREEVVQQAEMRYRSQLKHVGYLQVEKSKRTAKAPFSGFVVKEQTEVGQWLDQGDPIVTLAKLDEVDVVVNVDQWQVAHVRPGDEASVRISGVESEHWTGKVVSIVPQSDWKTGSRGFPVRVRLQNRIETHGSQQMPLLNEGMMATVTFLGITATRLMVHKDSLVHTNRGSFIHVFVPGTAAESHDGMPLGSTRQLAIELGEAQGEWIRVTALEAEANQLKRGDLVVTEGGERLRPVQGNVACDVK